MIKEMHLERFKKFEDVRFSFLPFTVLMGENSCGKTTVLQALNLAILSLNSFEMISYDSQGNIKLRPKGVGLTALPGIDVSDFHELYYGKVSRSARGTGKIGLNINLHDTDNNEYKLRITSQFGSYNIKCISTEEEVNNNPKIQLHAPLFISGFVGLKPTEERVFPVTLMDRLKTGHVSTVIRNLILDTKKNTPEKYDKLKKRLSTDFDFHLDSILFDEKKDLYVQAQYSEVFDKKRLSLDFSSSGSGFMQILQILAPIYRFCPDITRVVLLDEPDAHLHPNLQTSLANSLKEIQRELNIQIVISTHSTSIIRATNPSNVVPVSGTKKHCKPLTTKIDIEENIKNKIDSYSLAKSVISGKIIFFEDADISIWEKFDNILSTRVFKGPVTAPILTGRGKTDKIPFNIKQVIKELLNEDIEIYFIRDRDGIPTEWVENLLDYAEEKGINLIITDYFEIESYLLNAKIIRKTLLSNYDEEQVPKEKEIQLKIEQYLKETITLAKYHYDNALEDEIFQTGILLNNSEFRNPQMAKSLVRKLHDELEAISDFNELLRAGMGKEALKALFRWINEDLKLKINIEEILKNFTPDDLSRDIRISLEKLRSKEVRDNPDDFEVFNETDETEQLETEFENFLLDF